MITVILNDKPLQLNDGSTVADLLAACGDSGKGVAVAVNGEIVRGSEWSVRILADNDNVMLIKAAYGG